MKIAILIMAMLAMASPAFAEKNEISITLGSYHTNRDLDFNEQNLGIYYARYAKEKHFKGRPFLFGGVYDNSEYHTSLLAGGGIKWEKGLFGISFIAGGVTGYEKNNISPAAALRLHFSIVNILIIPDIPNDQIVFGLGLDVLSF